MTGEFLMSLAQPVEQIDLATTVQNRNSIPPDELAPYRGKWVAFSRDGSRVIAADSDFSALEDAVVALGEDPNAIPFDRVPDESHEEAIELGGVALR
jgi:hypothetical protein